jgi:hypothetical protein
MARPDHWMAVTSASSASTALHALWDRLHVPARHFQIRVAQLRLGIFRASVTLEVSGEGASQHLVVDLADAYRFCRRSKDARQVIVRPECRSFPARCAGFSRERG